MDAHVPIVAFLSYEEQGLADNLVEVEGRLHRRTVAGGVLDSIDDVTGPPRARCDPGQQLIGLLKVRCLPRQPALRRLSICQGRRQRLPDLMADRGGEFTQRRTLRGLLEIGGYCAQLRLGLDPPRHRPDPGFTDAG